MAIKVFLLPDLGEGLTEADLVNWLVAEGDTIAVDQPIAEVETAKSLVEVPSPFAGTVHQLHGAPGDTLDVGKPMLSVNDGGAEPAGDGGAPPAPEAAPVAGAQSYREEERAGATVPAAAPAPEAEASQGSGNVLIGYGTPGGAGATRRSRTPRGAATARQQATVPGAPETAPRPTAPARAEAPTVISPLVRKLARENGIDVSNLAGTGPHGLILRGDVERAIGGNTTAAASGSQDTAPAQRQATATAAGTQGTDSRSGLGIATRTPMKGVRKAIAQAMSTSRREIPEATVWVDVDATELVGIRARLKAADPQNTPGLLAFIARFTVAGLARFPELNTRVQDGADGGQEIVGFDGINLGIAAQTERGLMVPSIANADRLSARQLDAEIRHLAAVARDGKASPQELTRGTFTLNNYGVFGVDGSAAIINYPEVAILGVGRIIDRPWVVDGELCVRKVTELTLTFDHRVCDGGTAGGFLRYIADAIENPGAVLADL